MSSDSERMMLLERLDRAIETKNKLKEKAKAETELYLHAAEAAVAAAACGYFEGKTGRSTLIDGIGLDFTIAAAGFGLGFFGLGKTLAGHAYAVGTGGLSVYAYKFGRDTGMKQAAPLGAARPVAAASGAGLTDYELSRLVQSARGL